MAAALALSALTHKTVSVSHSLEQLSCASVNVVHIQRPQQHAAVLEQPQRCLLHTKSGRAGIQAVVNVEQPDAAIEYLLSAVALPELQQQLQQDLNQTVQLLSTTLQLNHVHAKLQLIQQQSCPNWHADTVGLRMLCTYSGPGTWYIANRYVRRNFNPITGVVSVAGVDESHAQQAEAGNLLFLKGNAFPGLLGAGAVHKSPELQGGEVRLLLTVDDACC